MNPHPLELLLVASDGEVLSATGARWVETGIRVFYYLAVIAIGAMGYSGVKRIINR